MRHIVSRLVRLSAAVIIAAMLGTLPCDAQAKRKGKQQPKKQPTIESVKKQKSSTATKITETNTAIERNSRELNTRLNKLNSLNADIARSTQRVDSLKTRLDDLSSEIGVTTDSVRVLERQLEDLRATYAKAMTELQPYGSRLSTLSFIFSAKSFTEVYSRIRYVKQFSEWRRKKATDIRVAIDRIAERRAHLTGLRHAQDRAFREAEESRRTLASQQSESEKMVKSLRQNDKALRRELARQELAAQDLDDQLNRLIQAEKAAQEKARREEEAREKARREEEARQKAAREKAASQTTTASTGKGQGKSETKAPAPAPSPAPKPDEKKTAPSVTENLARLTGSFEQNKGKMPFPVTGSYKIVRRFGQQPHPTLQHVMIDNSGIDIEVSNGANARAIFGGTVSAIFKQDGFNTIVMLRHGSYITVYAGLVSATVKEGDVVKTGQTLGAIHTDPANKANSIMHFEVRKETTKLNPANWVK